MSKDFSRISRAWITASLVLLMGFWIIGPPRMARSVQAQAQTCFTVKSGNGVIDGLDSQVQVSPSFVPPDPAPTTFVSAYILDPLAHAAPYSTIAGTNWVSGSSDFTGTTQAHFIYKTSFTLPASYSAPSLTIQLYCDNAAAVFVNGNLIGAQPDVEIEANFQGSPVGTPFTFSTTNAAFFHGGVNEMTFDVHNFQNIVGLDFLADVCYSPPQGCQDQDPPSVSCRVASSQLWPPNHQLENVGLTAEVTDDCDSQVVIGGGPGGNGVAVYSDEQDLDVGSGNFSPDAKNIGLGTLRLRSERGGPLNGRVYLIVVQATDASGKTGYCAKTVTVPHDQSKASKQSVEAQASAARTFFLTNHTPPPGFVQVGIGPVVGPKQ